MYKAQIEDCRENTTNVSKKPLDGNLLITFI